MVQGNTSTLGERFQFAGRQESVLILNAPELVEDIVRAHYAVRTL
jgi:hypothetical protein